MSVTEIWEDDRVDITWDLSIDTTDCTVQCWVRPAHHPEIELVQLSLSPVSVVDGTYKHHYAGTLAVGRWILIFVVTKGTEVLHVPYSGEESLVIKRKQGTLP